MLGGARRRRGAVYATIIFALLALLGMAAMTIDVGTMVVAKQQLQATADAAALAGVGVLMQGLNSEAATQAAVNTALDNTVAGVALQLDADTDVVLGVWDSTTQTIVPWFEADTGEVAAQGGVLAVQVTARRTADAPDGPIALRFARVLGYDSADITATATAGLRVSEKKRPPVEAIIVQDYSGSFGSEFTYARDANYEFATLFGSVAMAGAEAGKGDRCGYVGFGDYTINATNYPSAGWAKVTGYPYPAWSQSNISRNWPLTITRMDTVADRTVVCNKFSSSATNKVFHFSCGDHMSPRRNPATGNYYTSSTNTAAGLYSALADFQNTDGTWTNPAADHVVIIVSDGMPFFHNPAKPYGYTDNYGKWVPAKEEVWSKAQTQAAADYLGSLGVRLHVVTLCQDGGGTNYGFSGSDAAFNAGLVQNGGLAFLTDYAPRLTELMVGVASVEFGQASLIR